MSLAHLSVLAADPIAFARIAAEAGFDLIDLRLSPATPTDRRYSDNERLALCRELRPVLQELGLGVWDVEIIRIDPQTSPEDHRGLMEAAALLGARRVKLVCDSGDMDFAAGVLNRLCGMAAPLGLTLDLEYMVFSGVKSLPQAVALVRAVGRPNLTVLVDALHWVRAGDAIKPPDPAHAAALGYVQLCDGPMQGPCGRDALIREARTGRLPPGLGEFPLARLLELAPPGCVASVEVPLPAGCDPLAHARSLCRAARQVAEGEQP